MFRKQAGSVRSHLLVLVLAVAVSFTLAAAVFDGHPLSSLLGSGEISRNSIPSDPAEPSIVGADGIAVPAETDQVYRIHTVEVPLPGKALLDALKAGGLVLYIRHFKTSHSDIMDDHYRRQHLQIPLDIFDDCSWQRPLSDAGVVEARLVGEAMRSLEVPIGRIYASPYCRTRESAIELHIAAVDVYQWLVYFGGQYRESIAHKYLHENYLATLPGPGKNNIIVGHHQPMKHLGGIAEGETLVLRDDADGLKLLARIPAMNWVVATRDPTLLGRDDGARHARLHYGKWASPPKADYPATPGT